MHIFKNFLRLLIAKHKMKMAHLVTYFWRNFGNTEEKSFINILRMASGQSSSLLKFNNSAIEWCASEIFTLSVILLFWLLLRDFVIQYWMDLFSLFLYKSNSLKICFFEMESHFIEDFKSIRLDYFCSWK